MVSKNNKEDGKKRRKLAKAKSKAAARKRKAAAKKKKTAEELERQRKAKELRNLKKVAKLIQRTGTGDVFVPLGKVKWDRPTEKNKKNNRPKKPGGPRRPNQRRLSRFAQRNEDIKRIRKLIRDLNLEALIGQRRRYKVTIYVHYSGESNGQTVDEANGYSIEFSAYLTPAEVAAAIANPTEGLLIRRAKNQVLANNRGPIHEWRNVSIKDIKEIPETTFGELPMLGQTYQYAGLEEKDFVYERDHGKCVLNYLVSELSKIHPKYTTPYITSQFAELGVDITKGANTDQVFDYLEKHIPKVNAYALDPSMKTFDKRLSETHHKKVNLMFVSNNSHLYPIRDTLMMESIKKTGVLSIEKVKWSEVDDYVKGTFRKVLEGDYPQTNVLVKHESNDLKELLCMVVKKEMTMVSTKNIKIRDGKIIGFEHPNGFMVLLDNDYGARKKILNNEYIGNKCLNLKFNNQGWGGIAITMYELLRGRLPCSYYSKELADIIEDYEPKALYMKFVDRDLHDKLPEVGYDIRKCYTNAMLKMDVLFPIFSPFDKTLPFTGETINCGEYLVKGCELDVNGYKIPIEAGVYGVCLINRLLEKKYIDPANITHYTRATNFLTPYEFVGFITRVKEDYPDDAKRLINSFIGMLGLKYKKVEEISMCSDEVTAYCLEDRYKHDSPDAVTNVVKINDIWLVSKMKRTRLPANTRSIWRQIICKGILSVVEMIEQVCIPGETELLAIKTDAIYISGKHNKPRFNDEKIHKLPLEDLMRVPNKMFARHRKDIEITCELTPWTPHNVNPVKDESFLCLGPGGCGKSTMLGRKYKTQSKEYVNGEVVYLSFTNASCQYKLVSDHSTAFQRAYRLQYQWTW